MNEILISAGETSGDLLGANLIDEFRKLAPQYRFFGLGGDLMAAKGVELLFHIKDLSILGFWEVFKKIFFMRTVIKKMAREIGKRRPSLAILIDYPGFNLRLARILHRNGVRVFYYVSPQIWAWGGRRINVIQKNVSLMAVLFEFEKKIYDEAGVPAVWVGHPMLDHVKTSIDNERFSNQIKATIGQKIIGLFPGSRKQEVKSILPPMLDAARILKSSINARFLVGKAPNIDGSFYLPILQRYSGIAELFEGHRYDLMAYSDLNIICSGTATLESAILGTPMVVVYKTSALTYLIARRLIKIPMIGLVNVVAGSKIMPELIQHECTGENIAAAVLDLAADDDTSRIARENLNAFKNRLGQPGASARAAEAAVGLLRH